MILPRWKLQVSYKSVAIAQVSAIWPYLRRVVDVIRLEKILEISGAFWMDCGMCERGRVEVSSLNKWNIGAVLEHTGGN